MVFFSVDDQGLLQARVTNGGGLGLVLN